MKTKLESLFAWFMLLGLLIFPFVILLAISIPGKIASGKQVTFDRARASLMAALVDADFATSGSSKRFGYFMVNHASTNTIVIDGSSFLTVFYTEAEYQFANQGRLAVTTNRQFIWLDDHRGAKLIPDDYKVSKWSAGY